MLGNMKLSDHEAYLMSIKVLFATKKAEVINVNEDLFVFLLKRNCIFVH